MSYLLPDAAGRVIAYFSMVRNAIAKLTPRVCDLFVYEVERASGINPGRSDPLAESMCRIGFASGSDPPLDQVY